MAKPYFPIYIPLITLLFLILALVSFTNCQDKNSTRKDIFKDYIDCPYNFNPSVFDRFKIYGIREGSLGLGRWLKIGGKTHKLFCTWYIFTNPKFSGLAVATIAFDVNLNASTNQGDVWSTYSNGLPVKISSERFKIETHLFPFLKHIYYEITQADCTRIVNVDLDNDVLPFFKSNIGKHSIFRDSYCVWYIPLPKKHSILYLIFFNIILENSFNSDTNSEKCFYTNGFIWLTEWSHRKKNTTVTWKTCKDHLDPKIHKIYTNETAMTSVSFKSYSDVNTFSAVGFYSDDDCGGVSYANSGYIDFTYDNGYGKSCTWLINADFKNTLSQFVLQLVVVFHTFNAKRKLSYAFGNLVVLPYFYLKYGYTSLGSFDQNNTVITTINRNSAIQFKSNYSTDGFSLSYVYSLKGCGHVREISSPLQMPISLQDGRGKLCSWYYYSDKEFSLQINVTDVVIPYLLYQFVVMDLKEGNKVVHNIRDKNIYKVTSRRVLLSFKSQGYYRTIGNFSAHLNFSFAPLLSSSRQVVLPVKPSVTPNSRSEGVSSFIAPSVFEVNSTTETTKTSYPTKKTNFVLYGGIIATIMVMVLAAMLFFVCFKRKKNVSNKSIAPPVVYNNHNSDTLSFVSFADKGQQSTKKVSAYSKENEYKEIPYSDSNQGNDKEAVNDLYSLYGDSNAVPSTTLGKNTKERNARAENIYASSQNVLYGSSEAVEEKPPEVERIEHYGPTFSEYNNYDHIADTKKQDAGDCVGKCASDDDVEESNYACPDSPCQPTDVPPKHEYSYAVNSSATRNAYENPEPYTCAEGNREEENHLYGEDEDDNGMMEYSC